MTEADYRSANPGKLRIYDISTDAFRDATQKDISDLSAAANAYGRIRSDMEKTHAKLMADVNG